MRFEVVLKKTDEGYSVHCPMLRGCWSQGKTVEEALENIEDAIKIYMETVREVTKDEKRLEVEVAV